MGIYHGCIMSNIVWIVLLYHLLLQASYHRPYLKFFYAYLPFTPRVSYFLYFVLPSNKQV